MARPRKCATDPPGGLRGREAARTLLALFAKDYNARPGLVAGSYAGATIGMAVRARSIEKLGSEGFLGRAGRLARLGPRAVRRLAAPHSLANAELDAGFAVLEDALRAVAKERGLRC